MPKISDEKLIEIIKFLKGSKIKGFNVLFNSFRPETAELIDYLPKKYARAKFLKESLDKGKDESIMFKPFINNFINKNDEIENEEDFEKIGKKINEAFEKRDKKILNSSELLFISLNRLKDGTITKSPQLMNFLNSKINNDIIKLKNNLKNGEIFDEVINYNPHEEIIKRENEKVKAEANAAKLSAVAQMKHKKEEEKEEEINKLKKEYEETRAPIKEEMNENYEEVPRKKKYINEKVFNESWKLPKPQLLAITRKEFPELSEKDIEMITDKIYMKGAKNIVENERRFKRLLNIRGYNPSAYENLGEEIKERIEKWNTENFEEQQRKKNKKYILAKEKPKWHRAIINYDLNPMLEKGAFAH